MIKRPTRLAVLLGLLLLLLLLSGRAASELYTEVLWFNQLGFGDVLWSRIVAALSIRTVTGGVGAALVFFNLWFVVRQLGPVHLRHRYGNLEIAEQVPRGYVLAGIVVVSALAGWWLSGVTFGGDATFSVLAWLNQEPWGIQDPQFQRDLSFFVFSLPIYTRMLDYLLLVGVWSCLLAIIGYVLVGAIRIRENRLELDENPRIHFAVLIALLVTVFGVRYWLGRYGVLLEGTGFGGGVGYTDVHARLPALRVLSMLSLLAAASLVYGALRRVWWPPVLAVGVLLFASITLGFIYPAIVQKLRVEPTQLAREEPYILWNLEYTRRAFGLAELNRTPYVPSARAPSSWDDVAPTLNRLPLWDPEPLKATFDQVQSLVAYYHFPSVHYDRYHANGEDAQVAIAVREFTPEGLEPANRTWNTLHLNPHQVRGLGAVVTNAAERSPGGDPVYWVRDVGPVKRDPAAPPSVELAEPSVYFGETMEDYLVLGTRGDSIDASWRQSTAGIQLDSFARLLAFAWRFGDRNLLFAGEISDSSRLIFRRRVSDRVARIAPFLAWDRSPHPVIMHGRIVWMIDGYATSGTFPIAREQRVTGIGDVRYLQNVAKAVVDGVSGTVSFYALTDQDPILESYRRAFPDLFQPLEAMSPELQAHLLYPSTYLELQADVLEEYHVDRPAAFFGGENVWQIPEEQIRPGAVSKYRPLYAIARMPEETDHTFVLMVPFIARDRQNMTSMLVVRNDVEHYGEIVLLEFPRDQQVTGPRQIQSLIEQDPAISSQLSLWRARGSDVDYGRLRIVPLDSAMLYVQPIYLSAEGSPIPQLQMVILSDGTSVSMGNTLSTAFRALLSEATAPAPAGSARDPLERTAETAWPSEAIRLMEEAERALRLGDWAAFGQRWEELRALLTRLSRGGPGT